ncbi:MAG TPA: hypothetical protein VFV30_08865 [Novosphingobium sp.]|nr:hypothetical protein [Novosphingobium sp.]
MPEGLSALLLGWGLDWAWFKDALERALGVSSDALHVIVGVTLQLALVALLRTTLARIAPWALVLALTLLNEWNDFRVERWGDTALQWGEAAKDVGLTMLLPTVLLLLARWRPGLFGLR